MAPSSRTARRVVVYSLFLFVGVLMTWMAVTMFAEHQDGATLHGSQTVSITHEPNPEIDLDFHPKRILKNKSSSSNRGKKSSTSKGSRRFKKDKDSPNSKKVKLQRRSSSSSNSSSDQALAPTRTPITVSPIAAPSSSSSKSEKKSKHSKSSSSSKHSSSKQKSMKKSKKKKSKHFLPTFTTPFPTTQELLEPTASPVDDPTLSTNPPAPPRSGAPVLTFAPLPTESPGTNPPVLTFAPLPTESPVTSPPVLMFVPLPTESPMTTDPPVLTFAPLPTEPPTPDSTSLNDATVIPTGGRLVRLPPCFVAFEAPAAAREPSQAEYDFMAGLFQLLLEEIVITSYFSSKDFAMQSVEISIVSQQFQAGIPAQEFTIYMEMEASIVFNVLNDSAVLPTSMELFDTVQGGTEATFIPAYFEAVPPSSPFSSTIAVEMDIVTQRIVPAAPKTETSDFTMTSQALESLEGRFILPGSKISASLFRNHK